MLNPEVIDTINDVLTWPDVHLVLHELTYFDPVSKSLCRWERYMRRPVKLVHYPKIQCSSWVPIYSEEVVPLTKEELAYMQGRIALC